MATDLTQHRDLLPSPRTIPEGIRRSQEALRKALPDLLAQPKYFRQWTAFHGDEAIGVARDATTLLEECVRRGFREDEYYIGWIDSAELLDEEEVEPRPQLVDAIKSSAE